MLTIYFENLLQNLTSTLPFLVANLHRTVCKNELAMWLQHVLWLCVHTGALGPILEFIN